MEKGKWMDMARQIWKKDNLTERQIWKKTQKMTDNH